MEQQSATERILDRITGPFGALILAMIALWWLASRFESFIDQTMVQHAEDREIYQSSIKQMTDQLVINGNKIETIRNDVNLLSEELRKKKLKEE
jgi:hypothetical protein